MKMSLVSVVNTFVMCILFNIILPSGDVGSDIKLMHQALTFDLGDSLLLEGCMMCYHKTEKEVYYPDINLADNKCNACLYDPMLLCGRYLLMLKKLREFDNDKETCVSEETLTFDLQGVPEVSKCDEEKSTCCATRSNEKNDDNPFQTLDPKKLFFPCLSVTKELDFCIVSGKAPVTYCGNLLQDSKFNELFVNRLIHVISLSANETVFFYPYSWVNQRLIMKEQSHSITDPESKCGLLIYRHKNDDEPFLSRRKYNHYCNEDSCLTHLRSLRKQTSITDLEDWRKNTDYLEGVKVGGLTCRLLQIYGKSIFIPIFLNLTFNIVLFVNDLREKKANIIEIFPLMLLFYPQFKTMKFLFRYLFIHRDEKLLDKDKEENDRTVAPLEPFLESCLQVKNFFIVSSFNSTNTIF